MGERTLEEVLNHAREDAAVLRRNHHEHDAALIERLCDDVAVAAEDFVRWLSESEAMLRSGHARSWLRRRFTGWMAQGHARLAASPGRGREYRQLVIPQRAHDETHYQDERNDAVAARALGQRLARKYLAGERNSSWFTTQEGR